MRALLVWSYRVKDACTHSYLTKTANPFTIVVAFVFSQDTQ